MRRHVLWMSAAMLSAVLLALGVGRSLPRRVNSDCLAKPEQPVSRRGEFGLGAQSALDLDHACCIEFAVDISVEQKFVVRINHRNAPRRSASKARARAKRDITVPRGAPVASAMSR